MGSSSHNNPTRCQTIRSGEPCGGEGAYVYVSAYTTKLICDSCAREYLAEGRIQSAVLPVAIAELVPARQLLLDRYHTAVNASTKADRLFEILRRESFVVWTVCMVLFFVAALWRMAPFTGWELYVSSGVLGTALASVPVAVRRFWTGPRARRLDKEFGYPEILIGGGKS